MDFLHDLFCYAALFITLKYFENIMSTSPPKDLNNTIIDECAEEEQNSKQKREKNKCNNINNNSFNKSFNGKSIKLMKTLKEEMSTISEEKNDTLSSDLNLKLSSTTTTSDIIPIYEYSLKPASSTYMLYDYSTNCTSSLGNIPDSIFMQGKREQSENIIDDYTTDYISEIEMSSLKSSNAECSISSMQVHVSSATTLLINKTNNNLNSFMNSADLLHHQINIAAENIKKALYKIETSTYNTKESLNYTSNREKANLPSTSKTAAPLINNNNVNLHPIKTASQASEISSESETPHERKLKGTTHQYLMNMLTQGTVQNYHSHQELNDSLEVAIIDEHIKMNNSIHDTSMYSGCSNSDQFSNISGHGMEHLGEDELYGKAPIVIGHKNLLDEQFDRSPNGSTIAVVDFDVNDWSDVHNSLSASTSKN